jgi:hypothetical protein
MLVAAVAAVITIDQEVYAFVTPIPTASVSTVATAGIKTRTLKRCASAAPTKKLTVESTSTFGLPHFNGFAAGRLLPNTLILREGGSRYTTGFGIKIPIPIPTNDLRRRIPAEFKPIGIRAFLRARLSGRPIQRLRATQRALVA